MDEGMVPEVTQEQTKPEKFPAQCTCGGSRWKRIIGGAVAMVQCRECTRVWVRQAPDGQWQSLGITKLPEAKPAKEPKQAKATKKRQAKTDAAAPTLAEPAASE